MHKASREQITSYIIKLIRAADKKLVNKTTEAFNISKSSVYNYLSELCAQGVIEKTETGYRLTSKTYSFSYKNNGALFEDTIFDNDIAPLIKGYEKNIFSCWRYSFTEMMNNAIEHSNSSNIYVRVSITANETTILILDDGIGIFKNIQAYMKNEHNRDISLNESASLLFAGKFTTAKSAHSGEGIFFTSHLMDIFLVISDEIVFTRDTFKDAQIDLPNSQGGTLVLMSLGNHSKKTPREIFDRFSNVDEGFIKTQIPIAHFFPNADPVSRSEARRLLEVVTSFKEINLDFSSVSEIGQAFCHEIFIVWQEKHPDTVFNIINANEYVDKMIKRVKNTKY
ncbi:MAG: DUF4325 domain-containing protein [Clostridia bacterium]|nr:DUF4325 domain-containing protein [Clostridia bacterium]